MQYAYPCRIIGNEFDGEGFAVTFPDVYGANTGGETYQEAHSMAEDCLVAALGAYIKCDEDLPKPSPTDEGQELIAVPPMVAVKLALYSAMRRQEITSEELAERLSISAPAANRLLNVDSLTPMGHLVKALNAVGCRLVVEDLAA